jgi:DNA-binding MarR family transcriptional regulator
MTDERPTRKLSNVLPYRMARSNAEMAKLVSLLCERNGFTLNLWRVMSAIGSFRSISPMEIGKLTTIDKAMVSLAIRELVNRGLIIRRPDERDARWAQIELTQEGTVVFDRTVAGIDALEKHIFGELAPEKLAAFLDMLEFVERRAQAAREKAETDSGAGFTLIFGGNAE